LGNKGKKVQFYMNQQYTYAHKGDRFVPRDDGYPLLNNVTFRGRVRRNGCLIVVTQPGSKKLHLAFPKGIHSDLSLAQYNNKTAFASRPFAVCIVFDCTFISSFLKR